jgi:hypothetical protein
LLKLATGTKIENDAQHDIAKQNLKIVKDEKKDIDEIRKSLGEPFRAAIEEINSTAKKLTETASIAASTLNTKIIGYSNLMAAQRKAEEEEKIKNIEKEGSNVKNDIDLYLRVRSKLYALLVGGTWTEASGEVKQSSGCKAISDMQALEKSIKNNFPPSTTFGHLAKESNLMIAKYYERMGRLVSIYNLKESFEDKQERINEIRNEIEKERIVHEKYFDDELAKSIKLEVKAVKEETKTISKGIRKVLKFNIINEHEVPVELKEVSSPKVNEWARERRDKILEMLQEGKQPVDGLQFYIEQIQI